jgi:hypothetical protein
VVAEPDLQFPLVRIQPEARPGVGIDAVEAAGHVRFVDAGAIQHGGHARDPRRERGTDRLREHRAAFARNPGEGPDRGVPQPQCHAGCRADRIREGAPSRRNPGLAPAEPVQRQSSRAQRGFERLDGTGVLHEFHPQGQGQSLSRAVVPRGSEPPAENDHLCLRSGPAHDVRHRVGFVGDDPDPHDVEAGVGEPGGEPRTVPVMGPAVEQFLSGDDDEGPTRHSALRMWTISPSFTS